MPATLPPPSRQRAPIGRWSKHLAREWALARRRPILPAAARPQPARWKASDLSAAWLGHSTVLINFCGIQIITDPVLFPRCGIRLPGMTIGPKRLTAPALTAKELPPIDLVLLSHAHFDHFDLRTLHHLPHTADVVTAARTSDLLRWTRFRSKTDLRWGQTIELRRASGALEVRAFQVRHWGARLQHDDYRGYNGYVLEREGRRIIFGGDTAMSGTFAELRGRQRYDLALMAIGAYDPWIRSHATPEEAIAMADAAGAEYIMPLHHQTFRLSAEPFFEPIERFEAALQGDPHRVALRAIGETFTLTP
ncbi:MAG: MBL fold metallo-hydrolase [Chthoniobacterales bacterium]